MHMYIPSGSLYLKLLCIMLLAQVFDILPLHGTLLPGESQQMQFTFYGYADIATECVAACKVEGGPTYQIRLSGEASNVQYRFSHKLIDFGKQVYTCTCIGHVYTKLIIHIYVHAVSDSTL